MRSRSAALASVVVLGFVVPALLAAQQVPVPMPRDRAHVPREGTATLTGRVIDGITGDPIARARVRIGGGAGAPQSALTDAEGHFRFVKLPAGSYMLNVEKATYMRVHYPGAGTTVRARMRPLTIRDGESAPPITVRMFRGGAITGRVLDVHGDPVEYAQVHVVRMRAGGAAPRPDPRGSTQTNDLGEFRIGRLEPGAYALFAMAQRMSPDDVAPGEAPPPQPVPTYYPGVPSLEQAMPISVPRGQQVGGIELVLAEGTPTVVTGTIVAPDGTPIATQGFISVRRVMSNFRGLHAGGTGLRPDGTFRLQLAPGEYVLEAHVPDRSGHARARERYGMLPLSVGETPMEAITIVIGEGAVVTGRIVFDGSSSLPSTESGFRLPFHSNDGSCRVGHVQVNADWTFRAEGLMGTCTMAPGDMMIGRWTLKNVVFDGEDMRRKPVTFRPGQQLRNVFVTFTDRRTLLAFSVATETGEKTREYAALVFPTDKSQWTGDAFVRLYVPPDVSPTTTVMPGAVAAPPAISLAPGARGRPETLALAIPGEYYVVALDDIAHEDIRDPQVLERLAPAAVRVFAAEGLTTEVSLTRLKLGQ